VRAFLKSGGNLVISGSLPSQTPESGEDPAITRAVKSLMAAHADQVRHIEKIVNFDEAIRWMNQRVRPALAWNGSPDIRVLRRREAEREIVLVANPSEQPVEGRLSLAAGGSVHVWDPETGETDSLGPRAAFEAIALSVPRESALIVTVERPR